MKIIFYHFILFQEAIQCLTEHTNKIKLENRELRHELLKLIQTTRALNEHQRNLEDQRRQLLREQNYANDLKTLRDARQKKSFKPLNLGEEDFNNQDTTDQSTVRSN